MWDPRAFEQRWRGEFPRAGAPDPRLESVRDAEQELERCRLNLDQLQQVLAEEQLKASLLQSALAEGGGGDSGDPGRPNPEAESPRRDPERPDPEAESPRADLPFGPGRPEKRAGEGARPTPSTSSSCSPSCCFGPGRKKRPSENPMRLPARTRGATAATTTSRWWISTRSSSLATGWWPLAGSGLARRRRGRGGRTALTAGRT
ncbi:breakpoint cluster region protein-like [Pongo abelii]|uniref:breakpoint cluster region protein-like n=1 Tax=Pongo abelii TaxID=9601 RepID=UPI0023E85417|nr:breakpoint cluster region protein-like [Pongo abelii]